MRFPLMQAAMRRISQRQERSRKADLEPQKIPCKHKMYSNLEDLWDSM